MNFLRTPAAVDLLADGVRWLDWSLDVPAEQRWGFRELASELSSFLQWAWTIHENRLRATQGIRHLSPPSVAPRG
jgi:hypothetical protein